MNPKLGDLVSVACDSEEDARQLRGGMIEFAGIPASALKVKRQPERART